MKTKENLLNSDERNFFSHICEKNCTKKETWHYTSSTTVLKIFEEYIKNVSNNQGKVCYVDSCNMLASNIRFMNDTQEYKDGCCFYSKLLQKEDFKNIKDVDCSDSIYLISFCGDGDLLSQWKWYAGESGIAICFEFDNIMTSTFVGTEQKLYDRLNRPVDVQYTDENKTEWTKKIISPGDEETFKESPHFIKSAVIPFCKDIGFEEENESRLVLFLDSINKFNISYNQTKSGIKPALNVVMKLKEKEFKSMLLKENPRENNKNIISKLTVGPGQNQNLVFNALIHIFDRENYRFHEENEIEKEDSIGINQLNEGDFKKIKFDDGKVRQAYKCANGVIIMKSAIPFRG